MQLDLFDDNFIKFETKNAIKILTGSGINLEIDNKSYIGFDKDGNIVIV